MRNYPECRWCDCYIWYEDIDAHEDNCEENPAVAYGIDIDQVFAFHPGTEITGPIHDSIRETFRLTAHWLDKTVPQSPEQTLALRKLQEAMMFANAAVAIHGPPTPRP